MAKRKIVQKEKEEITHPLETQTIEFEDFCRILKAVENSEFLFFLYKDEKINVDTSLIEKRKIIIKNKKGEEIKTVSYKKDEKINIMGNVYDKFSLFSEKKTYFLPVVKSNGEYFSLVGGKKSF